MMKQEKAYKIKLVKILEILRQDSDEEHYIESTELLRKLAAQGIECDRRTLYKDIEVLNSFGYEVLTVKSVGKPNAYCVVDRSFDVPELRILMDAVQASSFITTKKTAVLLDKIADLGGSHRAELLKSNVVKFNTVKSANESIFYSINEITQAIEQNKKVSFKYFDYDEQRNRVYRKDNKRYYVNPLATVFSADKYYLIAYYGKHPGVVHYRIDRMEYVEVVYDQPKDPYNGEEIDLTKHRLQLFDMYQGDDVKVTFLADKSILDPLLDKFGETISLTVKPNNKISFTAKVQLSPTFFGWCLSFGDKLTVTAPQTVTTQLAEYVQTLSKQYPRL